MVNDSPAKEAEAWILGKLLNPATEDKVLLAAELKVRMRVLDVQTIRTLVTSAVNAFLNAPRTQRNRHVLEWLIESVDDINRCPYVGTETLLQRAMHGSGKPDAGVIKCLIKAGHSLTAAPPGGVSPQMALELMYGRPAYDKIGLLFKAHEGITPNRRCSSA